MLYFGHIFVINCYSFRLCPIFQVSNVTGDNLPLLKMFLNLLSTRMPNSDSEPAEFQIDDTYSVPVRIFELYISKLNSLPFNIKYLIAIRISE